MSTVYEIPLIAKAQTFKISLAGVYYWLTVKFNSYSSNWNISIADVNKVVLLDNIPLLSGVNLLEQFKHFNIGGTLICKTDNAVDANPTYNNLGGLSHVYFITS